MSQFHNPLENESNQNEEEMIDVRGIIDKVIQHWKLFPLAFFVCFAVAFVHIKLSTPVYEVNSKIWIRSSDSGNELSKNIAMLGGLNVGGGASSIEDNTQFLKSFTLSLNMVKQLHLNVKYFDNSGFLKKELYENTNPILMLTEPSLQDTIKSNLTIKLTKKEGKDNQIAITYKDTQYIYSAKSLSDGIHTIFGKISFSINPQPEEYDYIIQIAPVTPIAKSYAAQLNVSPAVQYSTVLILSMNDNVPERAIDAIDKIVELFNEDAINDKNALAQSTASFIDTRLKLLSQELGDVETDVEQYKKRNQLTNIDQQAAIYMSSGTEFDRRRMEVETQLNIINSVEAYIKQNPEYTLVPNNIGINDATLSTLTTKYNELVLERSRLLRSTNENNPIVTELNSRLAAMQNNLFSSIQNIKNSIEITRTDIYNQIRKNSSQIGNIPTQERQFVEIKRQQQIKESLFIFLLQKREEATLSLAAKAPVAKVVDSAMKESQVAPKRNIILMAAFVLSLLIPCVIIYLLSLLNNKIETRKELESKCLVPMIGEICTNIPNEKFVVKDGSNTPIAEMFRLLRTNLQFMLVNQTHKVVLVTSTVSGEGKSFNAVNLALSLALADKKVAIVGLDVRSPQLYKYFHLTINKGVTSFLSDTATQLDDIIQNSNFSENLKAISSGPIPPNPSELLLSNRLDELFDQLKERFDYVIVDSAPIGLVADTLLINRIANVTIYVCRQGYSRKETIHFINELKRNNRLNNMCILLNDTNLKNAYGYSYNYGSYVKENE